MCAARPLVAPPDPNSTDHFVYLHGRWEDYERLLAMRGESSVPRITYLEGLIELMSPSQFHEVDKKRLARLLEAWAEEAGVDLEGYGSWTLKKKRAKRGAEADECYTVNRRAVSERDRPDIAIEVIWTSGGVDKLEVYRKLGVREVWYYERGTLRFFALRGERGHERYVELSQSELLPQLAQEMILDRMLDASQSQTAAVRALRQAVRGRAG
jgi:Uma2 family endonuclease